MIILENGNTTRQTDKQYNKSIKKITVVYLIISLVIIVWFVYSYHHTIKDDDEKIPLVILTETWNYPETIYKTKFNDSIPNSLIDINHNNTRLLLSSYHDNVVIYNITKSKLQIYKQINLSSLLNRKIIISKDGSTAIIRSKIINNTGTFQKLLIINIETGFTTLDYTINSTLNKYGRQKMEFIKVSNNGENVIVVTVNEGESDSRILYIQAKGNLIRNLSNIGTVKLIEINPSGTQYVVLKRMDLNESLTTNVLQVYNLPSNELIYEQRIDVSHNINSQFTMRFIDENSLVFIDVFGRESIFINTSITPESFTIDLPYIIPGNIKQSTLLNNNQMMIVIDRNYYLIDFSELKPELIFKNTIINPYIDTFNSISNPYLVMSNDSKYIMIIGSFISLYNIDDNQMIWKNGDISGVFGFFINNNSNTLIIDDLGEIYIFNNENIQQVHTISLIGKIYSIVLISNIIILFLINSDDKKTFNIRSFPFKLILLIPVISFIGFSDFRNYLGLYSSNSFLILLIFNAINIVIALLVYSYFFTNDDNLSVD